MGIEVGISAGVLGGMVSVGRGGNVEGRVGPGAKVSVGGILVDVFSETLEGEAVGSSLRRLHAKVVVITILSKYRLLNFIAPL